MHGRGYVYWHFLHFQLGVYRLRNDILCFKWSVKPYYELTSGGSSLDPTKALPWTPLREPHLVDSALGPCYWIFKDATALQWDMCPFRWQDTQLFDCIWVNMYHNVFPRRAQYTKQATVTREKYFTRLPSPPRSAGLCSAGSAEAVVAHGSAWTAGIVSLGLLVGQVSVHFVGASVTLYRKLRFI